MAVHITGVTIVRFDGSDDVGVQITDPHGNSRQVELHEEHDVYHRLIDAIDEVWDSDATEEHAHDQATRRRDHAFGTATDRNHCRCAAISLGH
jgi:hypothetical protein